MTVPEPGASTKRQGQCETIPAGGGGETLSTAAALAKNATWSEAAVE